MFIPERFEKGYLVVTLFQAGFLLATHPKWRNIIIPPNGEWYNAEMQIQTKIVGLKAATILLGGYFVVWVALEGDLSQTVALAGLAMGVWLGRMGQRYGAGRKLSPAGWFLLSGLGGLAFGGGLSPLTLALMALKTGLHAHGPEFTPSEIGFIIAQIPLWALVGLLAGLGLGFILYAIQPKP